MTTAEAAAAVEAFVRLHAPERRRGVSVALWRVGEPELRTSVVLDRAHAERVRAPVPVSQLDRRVLVERVMPAIVTVAVRQIRGLNALATRELMRSPTWYVGDRD